MRATYELRKILVYFNGLVLNKEIHIAANFQKFDKLNNLTDEATQKAIANQMTAFVEWVNFCRRGNPKGKLIYFGAYARAEPIRMLLNHANVQFEDVRISFEQWGTLKAQMP